MVFFSVEYTIYHIPLSNIKSLVPVHLVSIVYPIIITERNSNKNITKKKNKAFQIYKIKRNYNFFFLA